MPQKPKRKLWRVRPWQKRRGATSVDSAVGATPTPAGAGHAPKGPGVRVEEVPRVNVADERLDLFARLAWLPNYKTVLVLEADLNGAAEEVNSLSSRHRQRQLAGGHDEALDVYEKSLMRISIDKERQRREANRMQIRRVRPGGQGALVPRRQHPTRNVGRRATEPVGRRAHVRQQAAVADGRRAPTARVRHQP